MLSGVFCDKPQRNMCCNDSPGKTLLNPFICSGWLLTLRILNSFLAADALTDGSYTHDNGSVYFELVTIFFWRNSTSKVRMYLAVVIGTANSPCGF